MGSEDYIWFSGSLVWKANVLPDALSLWPHEAGDFRGEALLLRKGNLLRERDKRGREKEKEGGRRWEGGRGER